MTRGCRAGSPVASNHHIQATACPERCADWSAKVDVVV
jgi:hypothetical protein